MVLCSSHAFAVEPNPVGQKKTETKAPPPVLQVQAPWAGASTQEMERLVTLPLEFTLAGMPGLKTIFSRSTPGLTNIDLYFADKIDFDKARQEVINRLSKGPKLPDGVTAIVTPSRQFAVEILRYTLTNPKDALGRDVYTLNDLKALQDWHIEREFRRVPGIIDVTGFGGTVKRYEIQPDPERLKRYGITLNQVANALANSNANVGGDYLFQGRTVKKVRRIGVIGGGRDPMEKAFGLKTPKDAAAYLRAQDQVRLQQIRDIVITSINNVPIRIDDVVFGGPLPCKDAPSTQGVIVGQKKRQSKVGMDQGPDESNKAWRSHDDVVEGIVLARKGHDASAIQAKAMAEVKELSEASGRLLPGVKIELLPAGERFFVDGSLPADSTVASASEVVSKARNLLREFPEVQACLSQIGPESEGLPLNSAEICVMLKPAKEWPTGPGLDRPRELAELMLAVVDNLKRKLPGPNWTSSPASAAETPPLSPGPGEIVVKVFGPDLDKLHALAGTIEQSLAKVKGVDQVRRYDGWGPTGIEFMVDKEKCKRFGIDVADVNKVIAAALQDGKTAGQMIEGEKAFDIIVRASLYRADESSILEIPLDLWNPDFDAPGIKGPSFQPRLRIKDVVTPVGEDGRPDPTRKFTREGAVTVYREDGKRLVALRFRVQGRAAAEVQKEAALAIAGMVQAPYRVEWVGRKEE
jgi:Cu/Ag efflux pump CusA